MAKPPGTHQIQGSDQLSQYFASYEITIVLSSETRLGAKHWRQPEIKRRASHLQHDSWGVGDSGNSFTCFLGRTDPITLVQSAPSESHLRAALVSVAEGLQPHISSRTDTKLGLAIARRADTARHTKTGTLCAWISKEG